jgi:hypothetical protein
MSVSVIEQGHVVSGVELIGSLIGSPEALEKRVRAHDELELGAADRIADMEHSILELNRGDALDVEHTFEIAVGHLSTPVSATERRQVPAAIVNEPLLP